MPLDFEQEGYIEDDSLYFWIGLDFFDEGIALFYHGRVDNLIYSGHVILVSEDDLGELIGPDSALGVKWFGAEGTPYFIFDFGVFKEGVCNLIGVDNSTAKLLEFSGDGTFTGGYATEYSNYFLFCFHGGVRTM